MSVNKVNSNGSLSRIAGGTLFADNPIGTIIPYGGATAPAGWRLCNGQAVSRTAFAELFSVIGTSFGSGDGSTTFNLPDMRESVPKGAGETGNTVGAHVKSGGLAVGEFLDDRVQDHVHYAYTYQGQDCTGQMMNVSLGPSDSFARCIPVGTANGYDTGSAKNVRKGTTTEVKSVGVNYIIKVKQVSVPVDFMAALIKKISLTPANNSTIYSDNSMVVGSIVSISADIIVQSGSSLSKDNAVAVVSGYGTHGVALTFPCIYRNTASGAEEPSVAYITPSGNIFPYYTKADYNELRISATYPTVL